MTNTATAPTAAARRAIYASEYRQALARLVPNCAGGRCSGGQISAAKGVATKRALAIIDDMCREA